MKSLATTNCYFLSFKRFVSGSSKVLENRRGFESHNFRIAASITAISESYVAKPIFKELLERLKTLNIWLYVPISVMLLILPT